MKGMGLRWAGHLRGQGSEPPPIHACRRVCQGPPRLRARDREDSGGFQRLWVGCNPADLRQAATAVTNGRQGHPSEHSLRPTTTLLHIRCRSGSEGKEVDACRWRQRLPRTLRGTSHRFDRCSPALALVLRVRFGLLQKGLLAGQVHCGVLVEVHPNLHRGKRRLVGSESLRRGF